MRRLASMVLAIAAVGGVSAAGALAPTRSDAARSQIEGSSARLALAAIPSWIEAGSAVSVDLAVEPTTPDLEVVVAVHQRLTSRIAFDRTVEGESLGSALGSATLPLSDLERGTSGTHRVTIDLGAESQPTAPEGESGADGGDAGGAPASTPLPRIPIDQEGVYPLELQLRVAGSDTIVDDLLTHLVVLKEDEPPTPLATAWIWPIGVDSPRLADGQVSPQVVDAVAPAGHLRQFTDALGSAPGLPLTLAPAPATLDAWADLGAVPDDADRATRARAAAAAEQLDRLRQQVASAEHQVIVGTYARTDLPSLLEADLGDEVAVQFARATDSLQTTLGIRPDPRAFLADEIDDAVLDVLQLRGVDRLVLREDALEPVFQNLTLARPFELGTTGRPFDAAAADAGLAQLLVAPPSRPGDTPSDAALAQRLLAGLAMVSLEAPAEARGVVVAPSPSWRPTANMLATVLDGLADHPALEPVTVDGLFDDVAAEAGPAAERRLRTREPTPLSIDAGAVRDTRGQVAALGGMLTANDPNAVRADQLLLLAESSPAQHPRANPSAGDYLVGARDAVRAVLGSVRLPGDHTVTLTAREGSIPITFVNELPRSVRVRVRLMSDKLLFPEGDTRELELPPRSTTAQFVVEARTSGAFPLRIEVTSPDASVPIGTFRMTVRSTAVSGVALAMTVGAGAFLLGWWGNHFRKTRQRRGDLEIGPAESADEIAVTLDDPPDDSPDDSPGQR